MESAVREIELRKISPNLRCVCDWESIEELAGSILREGQVEPIDVWFSGESFRILDGEKRWRACKKLRWEHIRVRVWNA
jgi:ParB family transcriptional regulator, chromosome partitioning protein